MTELNSMNDFHMPQFDRIGFQDLITENMAWWTTQVNRNTGVITQESAGKQPAWIHYQTDVDKVYGDFAQDSGKGFMVLQRIYKEGNTHGIADLTTYIDPTAYNYPFAYNDLTAQNFWGFFNFDVKARRIMSAKQIPNF